MVYDGEGVLHDRIFIPCDLGKILLATYIDNILVPFYFRIICIFIDFALPGVSLAAGHICPS